MSFPTYRALIDMQAPFGRVVWTSLATQLEKVLDFSTVASVMKTGWATLTFTIMYYALHKWIWRKLVWLSLGSIGYVTA
jgi:hypothetical protein